MTSIENRMLICLSNIFQMILNLKFKYCTIASLNVMLDNDRDLRVLKCCYCLFVKMILKNVHYRLECFYNLFIVITGIILCQFFFFFY